jgi:hypothetical protein
MALEAEHHQSVWELQLMFVQGLVLAGLEHELW